MSGAELEQALRDDTLGRQAQRVTVTVMVKASGTDGQVSVTASGCREWIDIPSSMIDEALVIGTRPCAEHSHPLARITLTPPKTEEGQVLARLLAQLTSTQRLEGPPPWLAGGMGAAARAIGPGGEAPGPRHPFLCYLDCFLRYVSCLNGPHPEWCAGFLRVCTGTCDPIPPILV